MIKNTLYNIIVLIIAGNLFTFSACKKVRLKPAGFVAQSIPDTLRNFRAIKGGTFTMGDKELSPLIHRPHTVNLNSFYIGETEVTRAYWRDFLLAKANYGDTYTFIDYTIPGWGETEQHPIVLPTWFNAVRFCNYYTKEFLHSNDTAYIFIKADSVVWNTKSKEARLPTEAEWEYACRGGTETSYYTGWIVNSSYANYGADTINKTVSVAGYPANPFGLYDMMGNVREWCWDLYDEYPYTIQTDPTGPVTPSTIYGSKRVIRGGGWSDLDVRSASRYNDNPSSSRYDNLGFRLAKTP